jgi:hypothetical protein
MRRRYCTSEFGWISRYFSLTYELTGDCFFGDHLWKYGEGIRTNHPPNRDMRPMGLLARARVWWWQLRLPRAATPQEMAAAVRRFPEVPAADLVPIDNYIPEPRPWRQPKGLAARWYPNADVIHFPRSGQYVPRENENE